MAPVSALAISLLVMLVLASPLFVVAGRRGRSDVVRRFVVAALILAALLAGIEAASAELIRRCMDAGNTRCVDSGGTGAQVLIVMGFAVASWIRARSIVRPF